MTAKEIRDLAMTGGDDLDRFKVQCEIAAQLADLNAFLSSALDGITTGGYIDVKVRSEQ